MEYTKLLNAVEINAPDKDVIFDGFDFTEKAAVTVVAAKSVTIRNSRIYGLNKVISGWLLVKGETKVILEDNFFGNNGILENILYISGKLMNGSSISKNYFADKAFNKYVAVFNKLEDGDYKLTQNTFDTVERPYSLSISGSPNLNLSLDGNILKVTDSSADGYGPALLHIFPPADAVTYENININASKLVGVSATPVTMYIGSTSAQLTDSQLPTCTVDGKNVDIAVTRQNAIAQVGVKQYMTMADAINAANEQEILALASTNEVTIPVGKTVSIRGKNKDVTFKGLKLTAMGNSPVDVKLSNLTLANGAYGIHSQNQTDNDQMEASLTVEDCIVKNFSAKGLYMTNAKNLKFINSTFQDCAIGEMDKPNTKGDYAFDLNLVAVKDADITLDGCTFTGNCGKKSAIKVCARGGASDADATDIPKNVGEATVKNLHVNNCTFSTSDTPCDIRIGSDNKTEGDVVNTTGNFPVLIENCTTEVRVVLAYTDKETPATIPVGSVGSQSNDKDFNIDGQLVAVAMIDDIPYYSLEDACAKATNGNTIRLLKNITCDDSKLTIPMDVVFRIPAGVTLDGGNHEITTSEETWVNTNKNHIMAISEGSKISNVTINGNSKTKSGILCYMANGHLENVTVNNCGNCGVQIINGSNVTIDNYTSNGNAWGSINADIGTEGTKPTVTINSATMNEDVEAYTEVLDETVITAPFLEEVIGVGDKLKGYKYYTSDKARLGVAAVIIDGKTTVYEDRAAAEQAASEAGVEVIDLK